MCIWRQSKMESFHIIGTVAKIKFSKIYSHIKITVKVKFHGDFYNAIIFQVDTKTVFYNRLPFLLHCNNPLKIFLPGSFGNLLLLRLPCSKALRCHMKQPGIGFLLEAETLPMLPDGLALSVVKKATEVIQEICRRDAEQRSQLVHNFFWVIVHGSGF